MINDRINQVVNYLEKNKQTSYKQVSETLNIKERYVRYDVDRINDVLIDRHLPLIEKASKGMLIFPEGVNVSEVFEVNEFVFIPEQRISFILLVALFDTEYLNIRKLSEDFEVSRSSIKNDLANVVQILKKKDLNLTYDNNYYQLKGNIHKHHELMIEQLKKYIYLYGRERREFNAYETYAKQILKHAFNGIALKPVITWVKEFLDELNCVLTDDSFKWYVSSIVVTIWYDLKMRNHPLENALEELQVEKYGQYLSELEQIINKRLDYEKRSMIMRLLMYTSRYDDNKHNLPMLQTEAIVQALISEMSDYMKLSFEHDYILYDGLVNHVAPLLERILDNVEMSEEILSILSEDAFEVFEAVSESILGIDILKDISNDNEIGYLTIHFVASIKRLLNRTNKRVLLVCGLGYGTTTLVRETLLSEYQVEVVDTIPSYKLQSYTKWSEVDFIITTMKIEIECCRKVVQIQPIFTLEDYQKIDTLGIARKNLLSNYYAIQSKLEFLNKNDRLRVLKIIKKEFGYNDLKIKKKVNKLSDLLDVSVIKIVDEVLPWQEAVKQCAGLLEKISAIDERYTKNIITCMNKLGFYSVIDDRFAILHGNQNLGVHQTKISLLVSKYPITFGDKSTNIVFCLSSMDPKTHIPAVTGLMNIVKETNFLRDIVMMKDAEEIFEALLASEQEVRRVHKMYEELNSGGEMND